MRTTMRWTTVVAACAALCAGCTDTELRCREGTTPVPGASPLRCAAADAGPAVDAAADADVDAAVDAAEVAVDTPPADTCLGDDADTPGDYVDQNCDGVDGVLGRQLYVSAAGADTNDGLTPARPFATLERALRALSDPSGMGRRAVLLTGGDYVAPTAMNQTGFFELNRSASLHGGYGADFRAATTGQASIVRGLGVGLVVRGTAEPVTLTGLTLRGFWPDPMTPPTGQTGYGLIVMDAGVVRIVRCRIEAPPGGRGADGRGPQVFAVGSPGTAGNDVNEGLGGRGCTDGSNGGNGGAGGVGRPGMSTQGAGGSAPMGLTPAGPAQPGPQGAPGMPGAAGAQGRFTVDGYEPAEAERGFAGQAGGGGGGGASGVQTTRGGGGGGGGGGGCGGDGGGGGGGGGGSIAVYALGCGVRLTLEEVVAVARDGGRGGDGVQGAMGHAGGIGGPGATFTMGLGSDGQEGAQGGRGGEGGLGGRGAGGPSLGLALLQGAELVGPSPMIMLGEPGAQGAAGNGVAASARALERLPVTTAYDSMGRPLPACGAMTDAGAPTDAPVDAAGDR